MVEYIVYHLGYIPTKKAGMYCFNVIDYQIMSFMDIFEAEKFIDKLVSDGTYDISELAIYPRYKI